MRRKTALPELLSPAGSLDALVAAVNAGADAVYVGTESFNARMNAKNFSYDELYTALLYAHTHGVKLYVTLNTLLYDRELCEFVNQCKTLSDMGVDAVIVADLGAVSLIKKYVPELSVHGSTQMSLHSTDGIREACSMGIDRIVPARELSFENIKALIDRSDAEIEIFLHGALCVSYSGQCLFSSLVGGRSGNRGECAQACRLPYNGTYPLSLCDLSLAHHIPELIDLGVSSLKIEGRMKSADYVYGVTSIYRRLLDEKRSSTREEDALLDAIFSRQGFTDKYFTGKIKDKMTGIRTDIQKSRTSGVFTNVISTDTSMKKAEISASLSIRRCENSRLTLSLGNKTVTFEGSVPSDAINQPLTKNSLTKQMTKMGQTPFVLTPENLKIELDPSLNMPLSEQNALRRAATDALANEYARPALTPTDALANEYARPALTQTDALANKYARPALTAYREDAVKRTSATDSNIRTALFFDLNAYNAVCHDVDGFFDMVFLPLYLLPNATINPNGVYIPPIVTDSEHQDVFKMLLRARDMGIKYALCGNMGHFPLVREVGLEPVADFRLNITNSRSAEVIKRAGVKSYVLSPELTLPKMRDIACSVPGASAIVFGRIPLMLTERCFVRENGGCGKCGVFNFCDRTGAKFPVIREYPHRNVILNSIKTYMGDRQDELSKYNITSFHFIFTTETPTEILGTISDFRNKTKRENVRRIAQK
ncbi:MAG: DUF3656 domain-containing protein [Eubacteriales bacterium]|nr:DUF3656 domain-containing protein [Eubacteriales bacterium]